MFYKKFSKFFLRLKFKKSFSVLSTFLVVNSMENKSNLDQESLDLKENVKVDKEKDEKNVNLILDDYFSTLFYFLSLSLFYFEFYGEDGKGFFTIDLTYLSELFQTIIFRHLYSKKDIEKKRLVTYDGKEPGVFRIFVRNIINILFYIKISFMLLKIQNFITNLDFNKPNTPKWVKDSNYYASNVIFANVLLQYFDTSIEDIISQTKYVE
jgi:hypothetical protein